MTSPTLCFQVFCHHTHCVIIPVGNKAQFWTCGMTVYYTFIFEIDLNHSWNIVSLNFRRVAFACGAIWPTRFHSLPSYADVWAEPPSHHVDLTSCAETLLGSLNYNLLLFHVDFFFFFFFQSHPHTQMCTLAPGRTAWKWLPFSISWRWGTIPCQISVWKLQCSIPTNTSRNSPLLWALQPENVKYHLPSHLFSPLPFFLPHTRDGGRKSAFLLG